MDSLQLQFINMKKLYVLGISVFAAGLVTAQVSLYSVTANQGNLVMTSQSKVRIDKADNGGFGVAPKTKKTVTARGVNQKNFIRIGSTYYDLQTNYSSLQRLAMHKDGAISATWTTSNSAEAGFPNRGIGYNFRSAAGKWQPSDSNRVENVRTGSANVGVLSNGSIFTIGHDRTSGGFYMTTSSSASSRPSKVTKILEEPPFTPTNARTANNGDVIHLISTYSDSCPIRNGVYSPMVYSRSKDGGVTWDKQHTSLPGLDRTLFSWCDVDQYTIDVRQNTVAIVYADLFLGVVAWKSSDGGNTFTRIIVDTFKYAPWTGKQVMTDTPYTSDGTCDVIIDNNNKLHVFWGLSRFASNDTSNGNFSFYAGYQTMMHWSEATDKTSEIASGASFDSDGDGENTMQQATFESYVYPGIRTAARLNWTSCLRQPSTAIDAKGNLFCLFSIPIELDTSDLGANFRDIGIVYSTDGGATWSKSQNVTQVIGKEDDFASTCRVADGFVHMIWQQDDIPGTNLQNNDDVVGNHPVILNLINYQAIPVSEILAGKIGIASVGVDQPNIGEVMVVNQNYPNPFSNTTKVLIYLTTPGDVTVEIRNAMGALVQTQKHNGLYKGNHELVINADDSLSSGVYTYSLIAGGSSVSKTMMVK